MERTATAIDEFVSSEPPGLSRREPQRGDKPRGSLCLHNAKPLPTTTMKTDTLAELIHAKRGCLTHLRDLGRKQFELIDTGEMTALLDLLAVKQRSLVQLQKIERSLDPFRDQDASQRRWHNESDRRTCVEQLQQCEVLLGESITQEKCSEEKLRRRRDEAAKRLHGVHQSGRARGAYTAGTPREINQLDLLSDT